MATINPDIDPAYALDGQAKSLGDYIEVLRRRATLWIWVASVLSLAAVAVALLLPAVYRSTATILIQEQEIPQELVRSTVTTYADERIQVISQQVMTRSTLLELVNKHGLYASVRRRETNEEILDRMRRDIKLTPISADVTDRRTGSPAKSTIAFTLSYDSESPSSAQKIANELTTLFLNENLKNRQQKAAETTSFIEDELARVGEHISELESQLAELKLRNQGRTPDLSLSNMMGVERADSEVQRIDRDVALLEDRRRALEAQLAETKPQAPLTGAGLGALEPDDRLRTLQNQLSTLSGSYSDRHPDIRRLKREIASLQSASGGETGDPDREAMLSTLRSQLSALRQRYSENHPDVMRIKRAYDALERAAGAAGRSAETEESLALLAAQLAALSRRYPDSHPEVRALRQTYDSLSQAAAGARGGEVQGALKPRPPDNPVYISLRAQTEAIASQIQAMRSERMEQAARRDVLQQRLAQTPEVERELLERVRDLDSSRNRFRELRDKQMQAQVAEQLERTRKAERFTIIDPPVFPERPYRPNRPVILLLGLMLALTGGFVAVALREALDDMVHGPRDVERLLQVPVLAVLPPLEPTTLSRKRRRMRWIALGAAALLMMAVAAAAIHLFYLPLDVAGFALMRRLGM